MDLIGLPWRITVGPRGLAAGKVELTSRRTGESEEMTPEAAVARVSRRSTPALVGRGGLGAHISGCAAGRANQRTR